MKNIIFLKQVYAFFLCVLILTSCTNNAQVGDALITSYPEESEIHIYVKWPHDYDRNKTEVKIFNQLKRIKFSNESGVRLFIRYEQKDEYGKLYNDKYEFIKALNAAEAKKYVSFEDWKKRNSMYP